MAQEKTKVVVIISNVDKAIGFEWLAEKLDRERFELYFILFNDRPSHLAQFLKTRGIVVEELSFSSKADLPALLAKTIALLRRWKPDVIHTHLFAANLIGHIAGIVARVKKRIYTRHSSNENRRYHGKQRYDRLVNTLATHVIAISENVRNVLQNEERVPGSKIRLLHHGFDLHQFDHVDDQRLYELRRLYNAEGRAPVIGVIARYSHWKGIQYVIPAFAKLLDSYPRALLVLANARRGDYKGEIANMLADLPPNSYREIEFEHDLFALYRLFDVYVHTPIDAELEAFGQTYVEALAAGVPSVFTLSGVAPEFIRHGRNALVVEFQNADQVYESVVRILEDGQLARELSEQGKKDVRPMFGIDLMIQRLEQIYAE
jgi:glycosyltransferase involved in cell wall biosynthesis